MMLLEVEREANPQATTGILVAWGVYTEECASDSAIDLRKAVEERLSDEMRSRIGDIVLDGRSYLVRSLGLLRRYANYGGEPCYELRLGALVALTLPGEARNGEFIASETFDQEKAIFPRIELGPERPAWNPIMSGARLLWGGKPLWEVLGHPIAVVQRV